ncbi:MAG: hypothetical protein HZB99_02465 [Candidatus Harrisonbacteria bacterium]|nr:hypothetical protein [Candidatus Harrisonbacteria bacterium]
MRNLLFWTILTIIGAAGWVVFVVFAVITGGHFKLASNFFGIMMAVSLPIGLVIELARYIKRKKNEK